MLFLDLDKDQDRTGQDHGHGQQARLPAVRASGWPWAYVADTLSLFFTQLGLSMSSSSPGQVLLRFYPEPQRQ